MSDGCPDQVARRFLRLIYRRASVGAIVGGAGCVVIMVGVLSPGYERSYLATVPYLGCAAVLQVGTNQSMYTLKDDMFNVHFRDVRCTLLDFK